MGQIVVTSHHQVILKGNLRINIHCSLHGSHLVFVWLPILEGKRRFPRLLGASNFVRREVQKENLASVPSPYSRIQSLQDWDDIIRCMLTHTGFQDAFHTHDCGHLCLGLHAPRSTSLAGSHNTSCFPRNIVSDLWITRLVDGRGILTRKS